MDAMSKTLKLAPSLEAEKMDVAFPNRSPFRHDTELDMVQKFNKEHAAPN
jgi:hypothetical protein